MTEGTTDAMNAVTTEEMTGGATAAMTGETTGATATIGGTTGIVEMIENAETIVIAGMTAIGTIATAADHPGAVSPTEILVVAMTEGMTEDMTITVDEMNAGIPDAEVAAVLEMIGGTIDEMSEGTMIAATSDETSAEMTQETAEERGTTGGMIREIEAIAVVNMSVPVEGKIVIGGRSLRL